MEEITKWLEAHPVSVSVLLWIGAFLVAWFAGAFRWLRSFTRKSRLRLVPEASAVFVENIEEHNGQTECVRAAFVLHAVVTNRTSEKIVVDAFGLSYAAINRFRRFRQNLLRLAFPARPRKPVGTGTKFLSVWFTRFVGEDIEFEEVTGQIEPKEIAAGYLLFVSFTHGNWNPRIIDDQIRVWLRCHLTTGERLKASVRVRVERDRDRIEELVPGLLEHIAHDSTWNHELPYKR